MRRLLMLERESMKRNQTYKLLYGASMLMVLGFCIHVLVDYLRYIGSLNSAPFWLWIAVDGVIWLIPAMLAFAIGRLAKKRLTNKEKTL